MLSEYEGSTRSNCKSVQTHYDTHDISAQARGEARAVGRGVFWSDVYCVSMVGEGDRWKAAERYVLNQGKLKTIEAFLIPRTLGPDCSFPSLLFTTTAEME